MRKKVIYLFLFLTSSIISVSAQDCIPAKPNPPRLVNDYAQLISPQTETMLESTLVNFNDTTSTQIAIVTVNDLCGNEAGPFAFELGEKWGVGNARFDNGVVILVKAKVGNERGQVFIAPGYGLEGALPDAIAKRIIEREMIPFFKKGDYEQGVLRAAMVIMDITGGEYSAEHYNRGQQGKKGSILPFFVILFFVFAMFVGVFGRARKYARTNDIGLWSALWLMGSMSGRHGGHYNNFRSGGGSFGGGGGFGGFGGGSFGGGGAGGSW